MNAPAFCIDRRTDVEQTLESGCTVEPAQPAGRETAEKTARTQRPQDCQKPPRASVQVRQHNIPTPAYPGLGESQPGQINTSYIYNEAFKPSLW